MLLITVAATATSLAALLVVDDDSLDRLCHVRRYRRSQADWLSKFPIPLPLPSLTTDISVTSACSPGTRPVTGSGSKANYCVNYSIDFRLHVVGIHSDETR
uniref:Secreted protein n=1 Tax=Angiostrongylus cantonensis TaxID=6313 RepID=A0A0K0D7S7_ANGCA